MGREQRNSGGLLLAMLQGVDTLTSGFLGQSLDRAMVCSCMAMVAGAMLPC